ncbi:MAG: hypothetical protein HY741_11145 [Chloroflexi bacterium]|nr:hypothetical protein [Chloroflexota bacterium]
MTDENALTVQYNNWKGYSDPRASGSSYRAADKMPASSKFTFNGTLVQWLTARCLICGQVQVYIDDTLRDTVNLSGAEEYQVIFEYSGLSNGAHAIEIRSIENKRVSVDAFRGPITLLVAAPKKAKTKTARAAEKQNAASPKDAPVENANAQPTDAPPEIAAPDTPLAETPVFENDAEVQATAVMPEDENVTPEPTEENPTQTTLMNLPSPTGSGAGGEGVLVSPEATPLLLPPVFPTPTVTLKPTARIRATPTVLRVAKSSDPVQPRRAPPQAPNAAGSAQAELRRQVSEFALTGIAALLALAGLATVSIAGYLYLYPRRRR